MAGARPSRPAVSAGQEVKIPPFPAKTAGSDDFGAFDGHPGPIAQFNYFQKLSRVLEAAHLVALGTN